MTDTTTTSINLDDVDAHLVDSAKTGNDLELAITPIVQLEAAVIAACDRGPGPVAADLPGIVDLWRQHDARLQTIYDILIATGSGTVSVKTQDLRDDVGQANGIVTGSGFELIDDGLDYIVDGGSGSDTIELDQNNDGTFDVTINGTTVTLTEEQTQYLLVQGGSGADTIVVNPVTTVMGPGGTPIPFAAPVGVRIDGGAGHDSITGGAGFDHIVGGTGRDYIDGGRGDDYLDGGFGKDTIYGGHGDDRLYGRTGADYLDGGWGADLVSGNAGNDVVAGGDGVDTLYGGADDDVIIGGRGADTVSDRHAGDIDRVWAEASDSVATDKTDGSDVEIFDIYTPTAGQIDISGDDVFSDRVQADLDTLAAVPSGAAILRSIDTNAGGHRVTVVPSTDGNNRAYSTGTGDVWEKDGTDGSGKSGGVEYQLDKTSLGSAEPWMDRPPVVGFHHELIHADDYVNGTLDPGESEQANHDGAGSVVLDASGNPTAQVDGSGNNRVANNRELSVVGLPFDEDDNDTSSAAPVSPVADVDQNTRAATENSLRDDLNLPSRGRY